jgi:CheY-like chemotaxis protein
MSNVCHPNQDLLPASQDDRPQLWTVLQIEDNPAHASLVEELISRRGELKIITATGGYLGLEMARSHQPDLILMDIILFDINGFDALKILRNDPLTAHIPVVALSSNALQRHIEQGLKAGFFRYLTKPFQINEFMAMLDAALDNVEKCRTKKAD